MNRGLLYYFSIIFVVFSFVSCEKKESNTEKPIEKKSHQVLFLDHTYCTGKFIPNDIEKLRITSISDSTIRFEHYNSLSTCGLDRIFCRINQNTHDTIDITEVSIGIPSNCLCPYDITVEISEFIIGNPYHFFINKAFERFEEDSYFDFELIFHRDLDTTIVIGEIDLDADYPFYEISL